MIIPILGDTHFGARNANKHYHEYFAKFYKDFFEFIDKNQIKEFIQLGDLFDVRKHVDTWVLNWCKSTFINACVERNLLCHVIVGNHDIHFRESLEVNTPSLILSEWPDTFNVISSPKEIVVDGKTFLLVPWIAKSNKQQIEEAISKTKAQYLCGHFEFDGFEMHRGSLAKSHLKHTDFSKFDKIISGHYHTKSEKDNVLYTGTPYETTWIDANDPKGFFVFDTKSEKFEFVKNQHTLHEYVRFPEVRSVEGKIVRGMIDDITDRTAIDKWKEELISYAPYEIKFLEKSVAVAGSSTVETKIKTTEELISDYIDTIETDLDKDLIRQKMMTLYQQALGNDE